jgi:hypothetical protein
MMPEQLKRRRGVNMPERIPPKAVYKVELECLDSNGNTVWIRPWFIPNDYTFKDAKRKIALYDGNFRIVPLDGGCAHDLRAVVV